MTVALIITFCGLLLLAYLFDLTASHTRIPSVILLLLLGWLVRQGTVLLDMQLPDLSGVLPVVGTIGLILIVLEGALELELDRSKTRLIWKSLLGALIPMLVLAFAGVYLLRYFGDFPFRESLLNVIPFCVISSAIAIPSMSGRDASQKEFVIYESSLSDILGVLFFNLIAFNENLGPASLVHITFQVLIIAVISFVATIGLSFLLHRIEHHIKFVPIILLIILIYTVSLIYHLPGLIFIVLFGLFIGNLDRLRRFRWIERFRPDELKIEAKRFKELTIEGSFLVRALFFLLFGYVMETAEILNTETLAASGVLVALILMVRTVQLKISNLPLKPLLFVAPRGLITILLYLSIDPSLRILPAGRSLIIQVIILTSLVMMGGLMSTSNRIPGRSGTPPS
jgi:cell volume regulation protein A